MIKKSEIEGFKTIEYNTDLCVIGGGMAGVLTAISAARHGVKVVLMQDRPVLGGNASSEVRMCIRGANGKNMRETGILEEIALESIHDNPNMNYSYWDAILLDFVKREKNITLILNCSCLDAKMDNAAIANVKGWQTTTQTYHKVNAKVFADCSGDSVLAPLTGAQWAMGREAKDEFNESIAPQKSDEKTMGLSCLIQAREKTEPNKFTAPAWAYKFKKEDFTNKIDFNCSDSWNKENFWWIELGGLVNTIDDTEKLTDELIKTAYGVWDFVKNSGHLSSENWELEWIGTLAGKRESRRYVGKYILNQNDVESEGHFDDIIAYGGWTMDDHNPAGFSSTEEPTTYNPAPSPYGIPYRCLISKNIKNLTFAGRNISATHSALSSSRVMATCGIMGQALGAAISIALKNNILPCELNNTQIKELQQKLLADDCYIPWIKKEHSRILNDAKIKAGGNAKVLTDGYCRTIGIESHLYEGLLKDKITIELKQKEHIHNLRIILDSDINRETQSEKLSSGIKRYPSQFHVFLNTPNLTMPKTILKNIKIYADGELIESIENNIKRLLIIPINRNVKNITIEPISDWGSNTARIYDIDLD